MLVPGLLALFLGAVYVLVPYACEPRLKGRSNSLAWTYIPFALWLAATTVRGIWTGSFSMMILPPVTVLLLSLHTLWMFRASWKDKFRQGNASAAAPGDGQPTDITGDSTHRD
jgi:hypothetical protein